MTRLLINPKSSEFLNIILHNFRGVPRLWDFSSGSSFIFLQYNLWEGSEAPKLRDSVGKKSGAPLS